MLEPLETDQNILCAVFTAFIVKTERDSKCELFISAMYTQQSEILCVDQNITYCICVKTILKVHRNLHLLRKCKIVCELICSYNL